MNPDFEDAPDLTDDDFKPAKSDFTCSSCSESDSCQYAFKKQNTFGFCMAEQDLRNTH